MPSAEGIYIEITVSDFFNHKKIRWETCISNRGRWMVLFFLLVDLLMMVFFFTSDIPLIRLMFYYSFYVRENTEFLLQKFLADNILPCLP